MRKHKQLAAFPIAIMLSLSSFGLARAQQPLDRTKIPPPGKAPELRVPTWTRTVLDNGATLIVSERHGLPLVSFSLTFLGGANQFEPVSRRGLAAITSTMLTEGTTTKNGDQLSDALQLLGTTVFTNIGGEEGSIGFVSTTRNFEGTLAILSDMMLNSTFPAEALERLRGRTLASLTQAKDQPTIVGAQVFSKGLYGTAQSVVNIGLPGPPRNTPDYFALQVLNTILGGQFQSRLNANIREQKGYSYGVNSNFAYGKGPGAFRAGGSIFSAKTDAALIEFMKEFRGIVGERPITEEELKTAKDSLIQGLPQRFSSVSSTGSTITNLIVQGLPEDYYQNYPKNVAAVTKEDLLRVAKQYIDLSHLAIVIVGDRASVEGPLKATGIAPITVLDIEGNA